MTVETDTTGGNLEWRNDFAVEKDVSRKERALALRQLLEVAAPYHLDELANTHPFFNGEVFVPPKAPLTPEELAELTKEESAAGLFYLDHTGLNVMTGLVWDLKFVPQKNEVKGKGVIITSRASGILVIRAGLDRSVDLDFNRDGWKVARDFRSALDYACTMPGNVSFPANKVSERVRAAVVPTSIRP